MSVPQRRESSTSPPPSPAQFVSTREQAPGSSEVGELSSTQPKPAITENTVPPTCKPPLKRRRRDNGDDDDEDHEGIAGAGKRIRLLTAADIERRLCRPVIFTLPTVDLKLLAIATTTPPAPRGTTKHDTGVAPAVLDASKAKENHRTGYASGWIDRKRAVYQYRKARFVPRATPSPT